MALPLQFSERLSCMYRAQMMDPWWRWYSEGRGATRPGALCWAIRLRTSAALLPARGVLRGRGQAGLDAAEMLQAFRRELAGAKSNPQHNALNRTAASCVCVRCIFTGSNGRLQDIVDATRSDLIGGRVERAFEQLRLVRGIGPKITSFFLRDLAVWFKIEPLRDREWLQPIDCWVRRYVASLIKGSAEPTDEQTARWICRNSAALEAAKQGL